MKNFSILVIPAALVFALAPFACGGEDANGTASTATGTGGSTSSSTSNSSSKASSSSVGPSTSTGNPGDCTGFLNPDTGCDVCGEGACCAEVAACINDADCYTCATDANADPAVCNASTILTDMLGCLQTNCEMECGFGPTPTCNPVTNEGCDAASGAACDVDTSGSSDNGYVCYGGTNDIDLCGTCDEVAGPYCMGGFTCMNSKKCAKYCCDDGDCGTGKCDKAAPELKAANNPAVGICVDAANGANAACDAPKTSPSNGACLGGGSGGASASSSAGVGGGGGAGGN